MPAHRRLLLARYAPRFRIAPSVCRTKIVSLLAKDIVIGGTRGGQPPPTGLINRFQDKGNQTSGVAH